MREISRFANPRTRCPSAGLHRTSVEAAFSRFLHLWHKPCLGLPASHQDRAWIEQRKLEHNDAMPKFVIERTIPSAGKMSPRELRDVAAKSCRVLRDFGPQIQWVQSYVTNDKVYCVYIAPSADLVREHALRGCFPLDSVCEVKTVIDPTTAE